MPTTDTPARSNRIVLLALGGVVAAAVGIVLFGLLSRPPQMGASDEVFHTVDALYTAVRNRDEKRVGECERRLHGYRESGELPSAAAAALDVIIRTARGGAWEAAAERLYEFMLAQRRDGAETKPRTKPTSLVKPKRY
ncbi:MAG: hypothetical protein ABGY75_20870 [Gemmataceae bacterium]